MDVVREFGSISKTAIVHLTRRAPVPMSRRITDRQSVREERLCFYRHCRHGMILQMIACSRCGMDTTERDDKRKGARRQPHCVLSAARCSP